MSALASFDLVIGFDCEYVCSSEFEVSSNGQNTVISYQAAILNPQTGRRASGLFFPSGPSKNQRVSSGGYLGRCIAAAEDCGLIERIDIAALKARRQQQGTARRRQARETPPLRIALCAHFSRADLPCFRDFNKLKKQFDGVRKTYASVKRPTRLTAIVPDGRRIPVSVKLFDTRLLAPAGKGSLRDLGDLLGFQKLLVPDVIDANGAVVAGIERMDLVLKQHRAIFEAYATRDAEVAVEWFCRFAEFSETWGISNVPPTIGALGVQRALAIMENLPDFDAANFFGRARNRSGFGDALPEARAIQGIAADCFHGGRNESFEHGFIHARFNDFDLAGAYTNALAYHREIDWTKTVHTKDLDQLALLEKPTFACIDFKFPPGTRFPCLPVDGAGYGLVFPLSGTSYCIGPELVVAKDMGAVMTVREGVVLSWRDPDGPRPFVAYSRTVNASRKAHEKGSALELLAKEAGNSLYGKIAQSVGSMKTRAVYRRVFDTREGIMASLPASQVTNAVMAAYTSGIPRAVLSEALSRLPAHVVVASATTDGWLSTATEAEARSALGGPVGRQFRSLRALVSADGSDEILEKKHEALRILQVKTRGTFAIQPAAGSKPIIARAGHRLDVPVGDPMDEVRHWEELFRRREYSTELTRRDFVSIRHQWLDSSDLTAKYSRARVALDWDFKRRPVNVRDAEGCLRFETEPWATFEEFLHTRRAFDRWREAESAVLKTAADWQRFVTWSQLPKAALSAGRTQFQQALMVALAKRPRARGWCGSGMTRAELARHLTSAGVPGVSPNTLKHAAAREPDPTKSVELLTEIDLRVIKNLSDLVLPDLVSSLLKVARRDRAA